MTQPKHGGRSPDVPSLLQALDNHNVRYVLTGSVAAQLYGIEAQPGDLDITVALDQEYLTRLAQVLIEIEVGLPDTDNVGQWEVQADGEKKWISRVATAKDLRQRAKWFPNAEDISTLDHLFHTPSGNFDIVPELADKYEVLVKRARRLNAHRREVGVAHVDELLAALTVPRRNKDGPTVRQLREIQHRQGERIGL